MKKLRNMISAFFIILLSNLAFADVPTQLNEMIDRQIKSELDGAYTYLMIAQRMGEQSYDGAYHWFMQQYYEELNHARILMDYIIKRGGKVSFYPTKIELNTEADFSLLEAFSSSLEIEKQQTKKLKFLYKAARDMGSFESEVFLRWFVLEQVEEEDLFSTWLDKIERVQNDAHALHIIDNQLKLRPSTTVFAPNTPLP